MNNNNKHYRSRTWHYIPFIVLAIFVVGGIIFLKRTTNSIATEGDTQSTDSTSIARPNIDRDTTDANTEKATVAMPDTMGIDRRDPKEAGYEDGYWAGREDGLKDTENASYDDSSRFPSRAQRMQYSTEYRQGYADGFASTAPGHQPS